MESQDANNTQTTAEYLAAEDERFEDVSAAMARIAEASDFEKSLVRFFIHAKKQFAGEAPDDRVTSLQRSFYLLSFHEKCITGKACVGNYVLFQSFLHMRNICEAANNFNLPVRNAQPRSAGVSEPEKAFIAISTRDFYEGSRYGTLSSDIQEELGNKMAALFLAIKKTIKRATALAGADDGATELEETMVNDLTSSTVALIETYPMKKFEVAVFALNMLVGCLAIEEANVSRTAADERAKAAVTAADEEGKAAETAGGEGAKVAATAADEEGKAAETAAGEGAKAAATAADEGGKAAETDAGEGATVAATAADYGAKAAATAADEEGKAAETAAGEGTKAAATAAAEGGKAAETAAGEGAKAAATADDNGANAAATAAAADEGRISPVDVTNRSYRPFYFDLYLYMAYKYNLIGEGEYRWLRSGRITHHFTESLGKSVILLGIAYKSRFLEHMAPVLGYLKDNLKVHNTLCFVKKFVSDSYSRYQDSSYRYLVLLSFISEITLITYKEGTGTPYGRYINRASDYYNSSEMMSFEERLKSLDNFKSLKEHTDRIAKAWAQMGDTAIKAQNLRHRTLEDICRRMNIIGPWTAPQSRVHHHRRTDGEARLDPEGSVNVSSSQGSKSLLSVGKESISGDTLKQGGEERVESEGQKDETQSVSKPKSKSKKSKKKSKGKR